jgi:hypothetical protein
MTASKLGQQGTISLLLINHPIINNGLVVVHQYSWKFGLNYDLNYKKMMWFGI